MARRTLESHELPSSRKRVVGVDVSVGNVTSDGGIVLLREVDRKLSLTERVAHRLSYPRQRCLGEIEILGYVADRLSWLGSDFDGFSLELGCELATGFKDFARTCGFHRISPGVVDPSYQVTLRNRGSSKRL